MSNSSNSFAAYTAAGRILAMVCNFAMPLFLTRFLTKEDYGTYSQFYTILSFIGSIFAFGIQSNLYYFYPKSTLKEKKTITGNTLVLLLVLSIIAFCFIEVPFISQKLLSNSNLNSHIHIISICLLFFIPSNILAPLFVIRHDKILSVVFPPIEVILKLVAVFVSSLTWGTLQAIFIGVASVQFLLFIFTIIYSAAVHKSETSSWTDSSLMKRQILYALPFGLSVILSVMFKQFDKILCIAYIPPEQYAVYTLAFFGIPGIQQVYDSVSEVNLLNMSKSYQQLDVQGTASQYRNFSLKMFAFTLPLIMICFLFAKEIICTLFTDKYLSAVPIFRIYILSFVIATLGAGTVLRATGFTAKTLHAYLLSLPLYLSVAFFGIKFYGLNGAITAAMVGIILPKLFQIHFERNILNVKLAAYMPWKDFFKVFVICFVSLMPVILIKSQIELSLFSVAVLSVTYVICTALIESKLGYYIIDIRNFFGKCSQKHLFSR